jgi:CRP/FNR family transcriptional regulator, cyclic AMP receptor protein
MKIALSMKGSANPAAKRLEDRDPWRAFVNRPLPVRTFKKGDSIDTQGRSADCVYIVREGMVLLSRLTTEGRETVLSIVGPGEHFGEVHMLLNLPAQYNSVALLRTELLVVSRSSFLELLQTPEACKFLMTSLAGRCSDSWSQIEVLACSQVSDKIRVALLWLCERFGVSTPNGIQIHISQTRLAQMVGTTRESLNRALSTMKSEGIIDAYRLPGKRCGMLIRSPQFLITAEAAQ